MAGLYGHEKANRAGSEAIYRLSWAKYIGDARSAGRIVATGYSCRSQAAIVDGVLLMHPLQVLLARLEQNDQSASAAARQSRSSRDERHEEYQKGMACGSPCGRLKDADPR